MTDTVISSASREVTLGFDRPFVVIGERINPTGRPALEKDLKSGDLSRVQADALAQLAAGAQVLDVNAGVPLIDEPAVLAACVRSIQSVTDAPLCIDSSMVAALEAGLAAYHGKALLNSVTGDEECLEQVLPLARRYGAAVIAIANDDAGISNDINVRFEVASKILHRALDHGIPAADVVVDPLVMPAAVAPRAGRHALELIKRLRTELKVNTTCGASNISFGLPRRRELNACFLAMAIAAGLTSAIANPLHHETIWTVRASRAILGGDSDCREWTAASRPKGTPRRRRARRSRVEKLT